MMIKQLAAKKESTELVAVRKALAELRPRLSALETQKSNPTVAPGYYRTQGKIEALEAVEALLRSKSSMDLNML